MLTVIVAGVEKESVFPITYMDIYYVGYRDWPLSVTVFIAALHADNPPKVLSICALRRSLTVLQVSGRWLIQVRNERFGQGPTVLGDQPKVSARFRGYIKGNARRFEPHTALGSRVYTKYSVLKTESQR